MSTTYNQKRKKEVFGDWVCQWTSERFSLTRIPELFDRDREAKKMHEEAFVVYQYLKVFFKEDDISIELRDGNQNFDAIIYDENDNIHEYLEVTCVPQQDDHLLRMEIAHTGQFSLKTRLTHNPSLDSYAELVSARILEKLKKKYPETTTLLVALSAEMILEDEVRFDYIISRLDPKITAGDFTKIVILDETGINHFTIHKN